MSTTTTTGDLSALLQSPDLVRRADEADDNYRTRLLSEADAFEGQRAAAQCDANIRRIRVGLDLLTERPAKRKGRGAWQKKIANALGRESRMLGYILAAAEAVQEALLATALPIAVLDCPIAKVPNAVQGYVGGGPVPPKKREPKPRPSPEPKLPLTKNEVLAVVGDLGRRIWEQDLGGFDDLDDDTLKNQFEANAAELEDTVVKLRAADGDVAGLLAEVVDQVAVLLALGSRLRSPGTEADEDTGAGDAEVDNCDDSSHDMTGNATTGTDQPDADEGSAQSVEVDGDPEQPDGEGPNEPLDEDTHEEEPTKAVAVQPPDDDVMDALVSELLDVWSDPCDEHPADEEEPEPELPPDWKLDVEQAALRFYVPFRSLDVAYMLGCTHQRVTRCLRELHWPRDRKAYLRGGRTGCRWLPRSVDRDIVDTRWDATDWLSLDEVDGWEKTWEVWGWQVD